MAMGTGMKVFLWILGIIVVLVGLLIAGAVYVGKNAREAMEEARVFAESAEKTDCLEEMAKRTAECDGIACVVNGSLFGMTCLQGAQGDPEEVCATDLSAREQATEFCSAQTESEYCVEVLEGIVTEYCRDPDANVLIRGERSN